MENFDPYHMWLGIAPHEQPPTRYRLLGLATFESSIDAINNAADQRLAHIRSCAAGKHRDDAHLLMREITDARLLLLDGALREAYNRTLRSLAERPIASPPHLPANPPRLPESPLPANMYQQPYIPRRVRRRSRRRSNAPLFVRLAVVVLAGLAGLLVAYAITRQ